MMVSARLINYLFKPEKSARTTGRIVLPLLTLSIFILIWTPEIGYWCAVAFAVLFGLTNGMMLVVRQTVVAEMFGTAGSAPSWAR